MNEKIADLAKEMRYREQKLKEDADFFARAARNEIRENNMQVAESYLKSVNDYLDNAKIFGYFAERLENILEEEDE